MQPKPCSVFDAIRSRRSVRAFLPKPVERRIVEEILEFASRAPSGTNTQPWKVWVVMGAARDRLTAKIMEAYETEDAAHVDEYQYYPLKWTEPYLSRRRKLGKDLYALLGIEKGDQARMKRQFGRNYTFFGAPVGLFVTIDRAMSVGSWFDLGCFLQSMLLAARGFGLDTCPQQAFSRFHRIIRPELGISEQEIIACGVALGYADPDAAENRLVSERDPVSAFATFCE